ncbi:hypothetical protein [Alkalibacterium putridalgicola]|uniref:hypothetical protein n=1 Tax=Alkalibacterium putridalgicola TaxID=426703 RepID=UPI0015A62B40|nr:hypothetical protein [Alkalibacterium putridalgicola]
MLMLSFSLIHFFSKYLSLPKNHRQRFLSLSAGIGVAYVFIHLWPQIAESQQLFSKEVQWLQGSLLHHALYLTALGGLIIFFSIYRLVSHIDSERKESVESGLFWAHLGFFFLYNFIIGILVTYQSRWVSSMFVFFIAFGLHFIANDWHLRLHHKYIYDKYGRFVLSISIVLGYLFGTWISFPEYIVGVLEAFITGSMVLNVIKSELPSEKSGSLEGFLTGVAGGASLFILL